MERSIAEVTAGFEEFAAVIAAQAEVTRKKHTPPMWANDPTKSRRSRKIAGQPTRQGKN